MEAAKQKGVAAAKKAEEEARQKKAEGEAQQRKREAEEASKKAEEALRQKRLAWRGVFGRESPILEAGEIAGGHGRRARPRRSR